MHVDVIFIYMTYGKEGGGWLWPLYPYLLKKFYFANLSSLRWMTDRVSQVVADWEGGYVCPSELGLWDR